MHKRSDSERPNCDNTPHLGLAPTPQLLEVGITRPCSPPCTMPIFILSPGASVNTCICKYVCTYICKSSYLVPSKDTSDTLHTVYVRNHPGFTPHPYTTRLSTCSRWCERPCICRHRMYISQLARTGACTNTTPKPYCFVSTYGDPTELGLSFRYVCMYVCMYIHMCARKTGKKRWRDSSRAGGVRVMVRVGFWDLISCYIRTCVCMMR
jgi:hypothetical protein